MGMEMGAQKRVGKAGVLECIGWKILIPRVFYFAVYSRLSGLFIFFFRLFYWDRHMHMAYIHTSRRFL